MDYKDRARQVNEIARGMFTRDGSHAPVLFLCCGEEMAMVPLDGIVRLAGDRWSEVVSTTLREMALTRPGFDAFILVTEAWSYRSKGKDDHTITQITQGEIRVSELNPEDRQESLMVSMSSRRNGSTIICNRIVRDGDTASLCEAEEMGSDVGGRFGGGVWEGGCTGPPATPSSTEGQAMNPALEYLYSSGDWPDDARLRQDQEARDRSTLHREARARRLAWEAELAARAAAMGPAQHPFTHDPSRPSLHP